MARKKQKLVPPEKCEMAFAVEIARGTSIALAAKKIGVAETTGYRWAKKPEVQKSVDEIRTTVLHAATGRIVNITGKAVDTLGNLLDSENEKIKLYAAKAIIDGMAKMRQLVELEQELQQIRDIVATIREDNTISRRNHA
jgi:phage terminase small subunit